MLVLSRKCQQAVVIEEFGEASQKLIVTVLEIRGARVRLGFDVAKEVAIHRQEVWERINGNSHPDGGCNGSTDPMTERPGNAV